MEPRTTNFYELPVESLVRLRITRTTLLLTLQHRRPEELQQLDALLVQPRSLAI